MKRNEVEPTDLEMTPTPEPEHRSKQAAEDDVETGKTKNSHHSHFDDFKKINIKNLDFIPRLELKGITDVFNNYATKKTLSTGFFNIALVSLLNPNKYTKGFQLISLLADVEFRSDEAHDRRECVERPEHYADGVHRRVASHADGRGRGADIHGQRGRVH